MVLEAQRLMAFSVLRFMSGTHTPTPGLSEPSAPQYNRGVHHEPSRQNCNDAPTNWDKKKRVQSRNRRSKRRGKTKVA